MFEHYKKTFWGVQALILAIAALSFRYTHLWSVAFTFVLVMELAAFPGALWATRIKHKLDRAHLA